MRKMKSFSVSMTFIFSFDWRLKEERETYLRSCRDFSDLSVVEGFYLLLSEEMLFPFFEEALLFV